VPIATVLVCQCSPAASLRQASPSGEILGREHHRAVAKQIAAQLHEMRLLQETVLNAMCNAVNAHCSCRHTAESVSRFKAESLDIDNILIIGLPHRHACFADLCATRKRMDVSVWYHQIYQHTQLVTQVSLFPESWYCSLRCNGGM
jgi:hypothetical protein